MDVFALIVSIVLLVVSVLNAILFFKIWGMTNNVKKMTEHFTCDDKFDRSFHYLYVVGKHDEIYEMLNKNLYSDLLAGIEDNYTDSAFNSYKEKVFDFYKEYYNKVNGRIPESFYGISRSDLVSR